jgi:hypothetical protein
MLLVTGICALGKGQIKLCDATYVDGKEKFQLYFSTSEGFPFLRVVVGMQKPEMPRADKRNRIVAGLIGAGGELFVGDHWQELVGSNDPRHVLKSLGEVRNRVMQKQRRRTRDIQALGNSLAEYIDRSRTDAAAKLIEIFRWTARSDYFLGIDNNPSCGKELYSEVVWRLLQVFNGDISPADIDNSTVHFAIKEEYNRVTAKLTEHKANRSKFVEFWSKPKVVIGVLPTFLQHHRNDPASSPNGLCVGEYDFSAFAKKFADTAEQWHPELPIPSDVKFADFKFKYYDTLDQIEEPLRSQINAKCGFIKMFGDPGNERVKHRLGSDMQEVLPVMRRDTVWTDLNAVTYARANDIVTSTHWIIIDKD